MEVSQPTSTWPKIHLQRLEFPLQSKSEQLKCNITMVISHNALLLFTCEDDSHNKRSPVVLQGVKDLSQELQLETGNTSPTRATEAVSNEYLTGDTMPIVHSPGNKTLSQCSTTLGAVSESGGNPSSDTAAELPPRSKRMKLEEHFDLPVCSDISPLPHEIVGSGNSHFQTCHQPPSPTENSTSASTVVQSEEITHPPLPGSPEPLASCCNKQKGETSPVQISLSPQREPNTSVAGGSSTGGSATTGDKGGGTANAIHSDRTGQGICTTDVAPCPGRSDSTDIALCPGVSDSGSATKAAPAPLGASLSPNPCDATQRSGPTAVVRGSSNPARTTLVNVGGGLLPEPPSVALSSSIQLPPPAHDKPVALQQDFSVVFSDEEEEGGKEEEGEECRMADSQARHQIDRVQIFLKMDRLRRPKSTKK